MMVSKKELQDEVWALQKTLKGMRKDATDKLERVTAERDAAKRDAEGAWGRIQREELRAHYRAKDEARVKRIAERKQHLTDLAAGRLDVKKAEESSIVRTNGKAYAKLTFPLDDEEASIMKRVLFGVPALTVSDSDSIATINAHFRAAFGDRLISF